MSTNFNYSSFRSKENWVTSDNYLSGLLRKCGAKEEHCHDLKGKK